MSPSTAPVVVLGASGMLGHRIVRQFLTTRPVVAVVRPGPRPPRLARLLSAATTDVRAADSDASLADLLDRHAPAVVVNAAGLIKQRPAAADPMAMIEANALLPHRLVGACARRGIRLIHISSDCVFTGTRGQYREDDVTDAADLYGRTKALGEPCGGGCLTLRTSIIGPEIGSAFGLLEWFRSRAGQEAPGYRRVIFPGLPTIRVARLLQMLIDEFPALSGLYHVGAAPISKHDLLALINARYHLQVALDPADEPVSDRSLDCSRFRAATGFVAEPWPELVDLMANDEEAERMETTAVPCV